MSFAIRKGSGPSVVAAVVAIVLFVPADPVTEILTLIQTFLLTVVVLLVLSRVASVAAWPSRKQWMASWSVAACAAALVCFEPLLFATFKR